MCLTIKPTGVASSPIDVDCQLGNEINKLDC